MAPANKPSNSKRSVLSSALAIKNKSYLQSKGKVSKLAPQQVAHNYRTHTKALGDGALITPNRGLQGTTLNRPHYYIETKDLDPKDQAKVKPFSSSQPKHTKIGKAQLKAKPANSSNVKPTPPPPLAALAGRSAKSHPRTPAAPVKRKAPKEPHPKGPPAKKPTSDPYAPYKLPPEFIAEFDAIYDDLPFQYKGDDTYKELGPIEVLIRKPYSHLPLVPLFPPTGSSLIVACPRLLSDLRRTRVPIRVSETGIPLPTRFGIVHEQYNHPWVGPIYFTPTASIAKPTFAVDQVLYRNTWFWGIVTALTLRSRNPILLEPAPKLLVERNTPAPRNPLLAAFRKAAITNSRPPPGKEDLFTFWATGNAVGRYAVFTEERRQPAYIFRPL